MQSWVTRANITNIALEMLDIHRVKADEGDVESNVCLRDVLSEVVRSILLFAQVFLGLVEGFEEGNHVALVCLGCSGKAGLVDAVVDEVVVPGVGFIN
jgi:hypothetical protein